MREVTSLIGRRAAKFPTLGRSTRTLWTTPGRPRLALALRRVGGSGRFLTAQRVNRVLTMAMLGLARKKSRIGPGFTGFSPLAEHNAHKPLEPRGPAA